MENTFRILITFWLTFFVWQRKLFFKFWKDLGFVIKTFTSKVIKVMKKVLYIVAKGRKSSPVASQAPTEQNVSNDAPQQMPLPPPVMENPIPDPMVVSTKDMETVNDFSSEDPADVVIKLEIPQMQSADTTLNATYHLAVMEKLNIIVNGMNSLHERIENMALNLEALTAEVTRVKGVHESAVTLLHKVTNELVDIKAALAAATAHVEPPVDTSALDALVADLKSSTDSLAAAVAANTPETVSVVLNADNPAVPTVEVVLPEVLPEVVTTVTEQIVETVDPASPEPQFTITVEEAPAPVVEAVAEAAPEVVADPEVTIATPEGEVATAIIETPAEEVNVTVTSPVEEVAAAAEVGVDVLETVEAAFEAAPEVHAEPVNTDNATTAETGGAPSEGMEGTQSGETAEKPAE